MTRTNKGSRNKYLPPKIQLQIKDSITGSFPTIKRISSDNRTGNYGIFFDDTKTIVFTSSLNVEYPSGLVSGSAALFRDNGTGNSELITNIRTTGSTFKNTGEQFTRLSPGQDLTPFRDYGNPGVDGINSNNSFFATGSSISNIGEGFNQALWNKTKIEIPLTPLSSHSFYIQNNTLSSSNFPMAYWNTALKKYQGIGNGKEFMQYSGSTQADLARLLDEQCFGFSDSIDNGGTSVRNKAFGSVVSNYGFPFHPKFHATSSNLIPVSNYINEPFLVEKIVLEFSGSYTSNTTIYSAASNCSISTFFILNQRSPFGFSDPGFQTIKWVNASVSTINTFTTGTILPCVLSGNYINTVRDLVSWLQITAVSNGNAADLSNISRDLVISGSPGVDWTGRFVVSGSAKNPLPSDGISELTWTNNGNSYQFMQSNNNSSRGGLPIPGGRDYLNAIEKSEIIGVTSVGPMSVNTLKKYAKINPYILMPGDNLILGWQVPFHSILNTNDGSTQVYPNKGPEMAFNGPSKLCIYGSLIKEGKEAHDTLNQILTTPSVNEGIK